MDFFENNLWVLVCLLHLNIALRCFLGELYYMLVDATGPRLSLCKADLNKRLIIDLLFKSHFLRIKTHRVNENIAFSSVISSRCSAKKDVRVLAMQRWRSLKADLQLIQSWRRSLANSPVRPGFIEQMAIASLSAGLGHELHCRLCVTPSQESTSRTLSFLLVVLLILSLFTSAMNFCPFF